MNDFRTLVQVPKADFEISHQRPVAFIGSCFSENMGNRCAAGKLDVLQNPFGILYNPFSIFNAVQKAVHREFYSEKDLIHFQEKWISLDHHGSFSGFSPEQTLEKINTTIEAAHATLARAQALFVTPGTAWVYRYLETGQVVGNCHKIPGKAFKKELLPFQDCHLTLRHLVEVVTRFNPEIQVVFTLSPIRHWRDGAVQNQRSKALLHAAIQEVVDEFKNCSYFPAYEIVMDDLRDYRFYNSDMLHPNDQAIGYIWQKFSETYFSEETVAIMKEVAQIVQAIQHRAMDPESNSFQRFVKRQLEDIQSLEQKYPFLDFEAEKGHFGKLVL